MSLVVWIDSNINNKENRGYILELKESESFNVLELFKNVDEAILYMKQIKFNTTIVIVSGRLYSELVEKFKKNILEMYIIPKIIVFTSDRNRFLVFNRDYEKDDNKFYNFGGIAISFEQIEELINSENENKSKISEIKNQELASSLNSLNIYNENTLMYEYIDKKEKLVLPLFFKSIIDNSSNNNTNNFTSLIFDTYSESSDLIKDLFVSIKSMPNIPIEILSKYYARLFSAETEFNHDLNQDLSLNNTDKYLPFIKAFYEGIKLKVLPLSDGNRLYRGSLISSEDISKLKNYLNKKVNNNFSISIMFTKTFLSFSKDRKIEEDFLNTYINNNNNLSKVLYIIEIENNLDYNLATHFDIEKISFYPNERQILFFPFSSFEIKNIKEIKIGNEKEYEITLLYLNKYLKEIENNKNIIQNENAIPESEFKKELFNSGLIQKETIQNINFAKLYNEYKQYEKVTKQNNFENTIVGEIYISSNDIYKDIQIINSFENYKRINKYGEKDDDWTYNNEEVIKENIEIKISEEIINFSYTQKFSKQGIYKIEYLLKDNLAKLNHMFYNCKHLTKLNLSHLKNQNSINMSYMFCNCESLAIIDLSNLDTKNVINMSFMFYNCKSLKNLYLSNFIPESVTDISFLFYNCESLIKLDLSNAKTQNVINMSYIFHGCKSLTDINLLNFNTNNANNISFMFKDCTSLNELDLSDFNTRNVNNMGYMFYGCNSLKYLNLSNFNAINVNCIDNMFYGCYSLTKDNIITKDKKIKNQLYYTINK